MLPPADVAASNRRRARKRGPAWGGHRILDVNMNDAVVQFREVGGRRAAFPGDVEHVAGVPNPSSGGMGERLSKKQHLGAGSNPARAFVLNAKSHARSGRKVRQHHEVRSDAIGQLRRQGFLAPQEREYTHEVAPELPGRFQAALEDLNVLEDGGFVFQLTFKDGCGAPVDSPSLAVGKGPNLGHVAAGEVLERPAKHAAELKPAKSEGADKICDDRGFLGDLVGDYAELLLSHGVIGTSLSLPCQQHSRSPASIGSVSDKNTL